MLLFSYKLPPSPEVVLEPLPRSPNCLAGYYRSRLPVQKELSRLVL